MTQPFHKGTVIRPQIPVLPGLLMGFFKQIQPEGLRGLYGPQPASVRCADGKALIIRFLDGIPGRHSNNGSTVNPCSGNGFLYYIHGNQRTDPVMYGNQFTITKTIYGIPYRILPFSSSVGKQNR